MRWLLDQGLPRGTTRLLDAAAHDAIHVGDIGMAAASDSEILNFGELHNRIVVTLDADFHALLAASRASKPSVVRIRKEGCKAPGLFQLILRVASHFQKELEKGCVMTVLNDKIRLRRLPL